MNKISAFLTGAIILSASLPAAASIPPDYEVTPADGSHVEEISTLVIYDDSFGDMQTVNGSILYINGASVGYTAHVEGDYDDYLYIDLNSPITADGTYVINLPAGFFRSGYMGNSYEFEWTVYIGENEGGGNTDPGTSDDTIIPRGYNVAPASGATVNSIQDITLTAINAYYLVVKENQPLYIDGNSVEYTAEVKGIYEDVFVITLTSPVTANGEHTIYLPEGLFYEYDDMDSPEFRWKVNVDASIEPDEPDVPGDLEPQIPYTYSVTPAQDATVKVLERLEIYSEYSNGLIVQPDATLYINGESVEFTSSLEGDWEELIVIRLTTPITEEGKYKIYMPAGFFKADYVSPSEVFVWEVNVDPDAEDPGNTDTPDPDDPENPDEPDDSPYIPQGYIVTPSHASEVALLSEIKIYAEDDLDLVVNPDAVLYINSQPVEYTTLVSGDWDDELTIYLANPITEGGEYTIYIPAGFFNYETVIKCERFVFTVTVTGSGTTGIQLNSESVSKGQIYDLNGIKVENPQKGKIYIKEGKKIIY